VALNKRIQINQTTRFTIRADAITILNTRSGNPNMDINSSSPGTHHQRLRRAAVPEQRTHRF
jgi:hypothetical protein